jgi:hypothetical protein
LKAATDAAGCVLTFLFVPSDTATGALTDLVSTRPPVSWVASVVNTVTDFSGSVAYRSTVGLCDGVTFAPFGSLSHLPVQVRTFAVQFPGPSAVGCSQPGSDAANLFGWRLVVRDLLALGLFLGFVRLIWKLLPITGFVGEIHDRWTGRGNGEEEV